MRKTVVIPVTWPGEAGLAELLARALILITALEQEFASGTRMFARDGREVTELEDALTCLLQDGHLSMKPTPGREHVFNRMAALGPIVHLAN